MAHGRVMLDNGSSASCEYDFIDAHRGVLKLPHNFFTAHGQTVHPATLELADGAHRTVSVTLGPRVGEAEFFLAE